MEPTGIERVASCCKERAAHDLCRSDHDISASYGRFWLILAISAGALAISEASIKLPCSPSVSLVACGIVPAHA
jgi:hypothetical protein